jgi:predicted NUDIX family phosphoesterase
MKNQNTLFPTPPIINTHQEEILVIPRRILFQKEYPWQGLKTDNFDDYIVSIHEQQEFRPRWQMEQDLSFKQIIPYMIFNYQDQFFLMQRKSTASEQRLQSKFSLGIGGHIRKEDMKTKNIMTWAQREFDEEISYTGSYKITPLGILNDDATDVGRVHLGLILLLQGDSSVISIKSELQHGFLADYKTCMLRYDQMETWTQIVMPHLEKYI